jgi:predicted permease
VSFVDSVPLSVGGVTDIFKIEGGKDRAEQTVLADVYGVGRDYWKTMGIPLLRGRDFSRQSGDEHAAIINEALARRAFGNEDPLGRQIFGYEDGPKTAYTIIGVARNSKSHTLGENPRDCAYLFVEANPQNVPSFFGISIAVKTAGSPGGLAKPVRDQIAALDPNLAILRTETMREHVDKSLLLPQISATLLGVFGAVGLTLAAIGLYGVMSFSVRCRTREIGIRMALGAKPGGVVRMVLRQGLALTGVGLVIGLGIALAVGRLAESLLYGVSGTDPITFLAVPAVLLAAALVAIIVPARRVVRAGPMAALRME